MHGGARGRKRRGRGGRQPQLSFLLSFLCVVVFAAAAVLPHLS
jgi:hypothetical protein